MALRLLLTRELPEPDRTQGVITDQITGEMFGYTIEPGLDDRAFPRVPTGFYALEDHASPRFGATVALVGAEVSHEHTIGIDRSAILIHAGNRDDDTQGCIVIGLTRGKLHGEPAVLNSRKALDILLDRIHGEQHAYMTIR